MLQIARIARAHYAHTSAVPLSLLRRPAPPSAYVSRPAPSFPYPSSSAHSKKMATAVASTMPANLSWSTASAQAAGLDMALLEKISTVFVPSDEVGGGPGWFGQQSGELGQPLKGGRLREHLGGGGGGTGGIGEIWTGTCGRVNVLLC